MVASSRVVRRSFWLAMISSVARSRPTTIAPPVNQTVSGLPPVSAACISRPTEIAPAAIGTLVAASPVLGRARAVLGCQAA